MPKTVYYLVHKDTHRRLGYYKTLGGARIAQRSRNRLLGFHTRIARIDIEENFTAEQCINTDNEIVYATYCIQEDHIDTLNDELIINE